MFSGLFYAKTARKVLCEIYKNKMFGPKYVWFFIGWYEDDWFMDQQYLSDEGVECTQDQMIEVSFMLDIWVWCVYLPFHILNSAHIKLKWWNLAFSGLSDYKIGFTTFRPQDEAQIFQLRIINHAADGYT